MANNNDFKIILEAMIDNSSLTNVQKQLAKERLKINADITIEDFAKSKQEIEKQIGKLAESIRTILGNSVSDKQASQWAKQYYDQMISGAKQATKEQDSLINAMAKGREQAELARQAEEERQQVAQNRAINKALEEEYAQKQKLIEQEQKLAQLNAERVNKIQLSNDITKLETDYKKFGIVSQEVENNLKELKIARENALKAEGTENASAEIEKYNKKLAETKSSWEELQATQVSLNQRTSQMTSMQEWMRKNKAATKLCGDQVEKLIQECKTCDKVRFEGIKNEFKQIQVEAGKAGKLGNSFFGGLIDQAKKFTQWIGVTGAVMKGLQIGRDMKQAVYDIDTAMTNLYKVTDETDVKYNEFLNSACDNAQRLGRSVSSLVEQTANWAKLGYGIDEASKLAETSSIYANVGEVDDTTAVSDIVTVMKANFKCLYV